MIMNTTIPSSDKNKTYHIRSRKNRFYDVTYLYLIINSLLPYTFAHLRRTIYTISTYYIMARESVRNEEQSKPNHYFQSF